MQISNRNEPVECEHCGKRVARNERRQRYCSRRCQRAARYAENVKSGKFNGTGSLPSGEWLTPPKKSNDLNSLQGPKTGSSLPWNILGGGRWQFADAVPPDADLIAKNSSL